jgi:hypothetical protein
MSAGVDLKAVSVDEAYVSGPDDYAAVHGLQDQHRLVPLKPWGTDWTPPADSAVQPGVDVKTPVPRQVFADDAREVLRAAERAIARQPALPRGRAGDAADRPDRHRARRRVSWNCFDPG